MKSIIFDRVKIKADACENRYAKKPHHQQRATFLSWYYDIKHLKLDDINFAFFPSPLYSSRNHHTCKRWRQIDRHTRRRRHQPALSLQQGVFEQEFHLFLVEEFTEIRECCFWRKIAEFQLHVSTRHTKAIDDNLRCLQQLPLNVMSHSHEIWGRKNRHHTTQRSPSPATTA